ncbi:MAG TPA: gamma-glutamyltransferase [Dehalococcoidia bacterium]|nr:gamma-glutamyltransferase [Dehalococcoidia bacterium]
MSAPAFPKAAVASPHYLASSAGLAVLGRGGNAVDAAIAMNLVLAVVYPHMCGLGGDLLAMVWHDGKLHGLNSTGRLPAGAQRHEKVPSRGVGSATVPGAVAGWRALHDKFASHDFDDLAKPAVQYARFGVPRAPGLRKITDLMRPLLERDPETARIFLGPDPLLQLDLADTLKNLEDFAALVGERAPLPFTRDDFEEHEAEWVEPVRTDWRGLEVCEMPPNSRGHLALAALDRLEPLDGLTPDDPEFHRRLIRSFAEPAHGDGDTIYLCAVDETGMAVSLNQSLYQAFGSGVTVRGTGVLLHNRGAYFKPEEYVAGAKPVHTLAPAMALRDGKPRLVFGTMGGEAQIQVHLQLLARIFVAGQEPGEAIAAPRWRFGEDGMLAEAGLPELGAAPMALPDQAGHAYAILVEPGHLVAAFDPRSDGAALGY